MVSPYFRFTFHDLETLSDLSRNSNTLGRRQYELLCHFAENPATSAYDISPARKNDKSEDYKDAKKRRKQLKDLGLIEEVIKYPNIHNARYYKLSARGVYYLIANNTSLQYDILKNLLKNYGDHLLFQCFLYPCVNHMTLLKIGDSAIFSHTFSYLHDCCERVHETIYMVSHTYNQQNGNVTRPLFSWDNISREEKEALRSFLKIRLKRNWVDNAEVNKTDDGNSIKVSSGLNSLLITLSEDKTIATLSVRGKKLEFDVKGSNVWASEVPPISLEEIHMRFFEGFLQMRVQQFIFSLLSNYGPERGSVSAAIRILSQDSKFMQALKEMKNQFEKRYTFFIEKRNSRLSTKRIT
jgi:hypothetical protein